MPLQIDRVDTEIDVVPDEQPPMGGPGPMVPAGGPAVMDDAAREQLRALIVGIVEAELDRLWRERG